jgi:hypothetical protein
MSFREKMKNGGGGGLFPLLVGVVGFGGLVLLPINIVFNISGPWCFHTTLLLQLFSWHKHLKL